MTRSEPILRNELLERTESWKWVELPTTKHTPIIPGIHKSAAPNSFHYSAETLPAPNSSRPKQRWYPWLNLSHSLFAYFFHAQSSDVSSYMLLYWVRAIFVARHRQMRAPVQIRKKPAERHTGLVLLETRSGVPHVNGFNSRGKKDFFIIIKFIGLRNMF